MEEKDEMNTMLEEMMKEAEALRIKLADKERRIIQLEEGIAKACNFILQKGSPSTSKR